MNASKLLGTLFQSRDIIHLAHLNTSNYAEHIALGNYYDGILDLTDTFAETYFGRFKRVDIIIPASKIQNAQEHLKEMQKYIDSEREQYPSELQNIMDEMLGLINKTLYLLTLV